MKSNLRYTVDFVHRFTKVEQTTVVDLCELTGDEIRTAMRGPGGVYGPVAKAFAFKYAALKMPTEFMGMPETVQAFRVQ